MIYEIAYLIIFFFGGRYILDAIKEYHFTEGLTYKFIKLLFFGFDINFTDKQIYMFIKFIGIGLFCIAVMKFLYRIYKGKYTLIKLSINTDKNNKIYTILTNLRSGTMTAILCVFFIFMIPSPVLFVMRAEKSLILKIFFTYTGIILWFSLLVCKRVERNAIEIKNFYRRILNEYSELLINNNGIKNERMRKLEETAEQINNQRIIDAKKAAKRAMVTSAAAYVAGTYAGKKIGDAIVKHNNDFLSETIIKDGKEVRVSSHDVFVENMRKELSEL